MIGSSMLRRALFLPTRTLRYATVGRVHARLYSDKPTVSNDDAEGSTEANTKPASDVDFMSILKDITGDMPSSTNHKSEQSILEGERMNVFPPLELMQSEGTMDAKELELLEQKRAILEQEYELTDANAAMKDWKDASEGQGVPTTQDLYGDKYGDLSDPLNRKLYDNDLRSAHDIRAAFKRIEHGMGNMTLEEGMTHLMGVIKDSGATNKLDLYRALPQIVVNTKWSIRHKEQVLRDHMEGVEFTPEQKKRLDARDRKGKRFVAIIQRMLADKAVRAKEKAEREKEEMIAKIKALQAEDDDLSWESHEKQEQALVRERNKKRTAKARLGIEKRKLERRLKKERMQKKR